jgi:hypothetical protein
VSLSVFVLVDAILLVGNHTISEYLRIVRINKEKPFCFVEAFDEEDNKIEFFHHLGDNPLGLKEDDEIRFVVAETPRGVQATQVSKVNQDKQAA